MSTAIFDSLTDSQRQAVEHIDGPLLILAGPGSGKTRVVTHRIANLIANGISPESILALTFTNKAADEMKRRVAGLTAESNVWMGTFHRFCAQMLRRYASYAGLESNYTIYDMKDSRQALQHALNGLDLDLTHTPLDSLVKMISWTKNQLVTHDQYVPKPGSTIGPVMAVAYPAYQKQLLDSNAVDFDDLLMHIAMILRQSNDLRGMLDERFKYILVDEYQDTNLAQYAIVRALSIDHANLAVTGDPDQSIYGWRGANISNILEFEKDYPSVKVVRLEQNYRSTPEILSVADALIANNSRRLKKSLFTDNTSGPPVKLVNYATQKEEADGIAAKIRTELTAGKRKLQDFAIFFRVNALSRSIESALRENGLPYQVVNGLEFYQRKEIKDIFAYLHLLNNPRDDVAFLRIVNVPTRKIGKVTINKLTDYARRNGLSLLESARQAGLNDKIAKGTAVNIAKFVTLIDKLGERTLAPIEEIMGHILVETGYRDQYVDPKSDDANPEASNPDDQERLANIEELLTDAREFDSENPGVGHLEEFLERTALYSDTDAWESGVDRVTLMTLHAAKGLEFPVVFITAIEQGLLPHDRSKQTIDGIEEERRLLFVGITRAMQELQLSLAQKRAFRGKVNRTVPSEFLMELPRSEMDVAEKQRYVPDFFDESFQDAPDDEIVYEQYADTDESEPEPIANFATADTLLKSASTNGTTNEDNGDSDGAANRADINPNDSVSEPKVELKPINPNVFRVGMAVNHPDHGLGKVVALSGNGKQRTATINFVLGPEPMKIILAFSPLRPVGPA